MIRHALPLLIAALPDGVIVHAPDGQITAVNDRFCSLTGFSRDDLVGQRPPFAFWTRVEAAEGVMGYLQAGTVERDLLFTRKDGSEVPVIVSAASLPTLPALPTLPSPPSDSSASAAGGAATVAGTSSAGWVVTVKDATDRRRTERRLAAQYAVTRALSEATTFSEASWRVLQAVGQSLGWIFGAAWLPRADGRLRCERTWHEVGTDVRAFDDLCLTATFGPGEGLPGQVLERGEPVWLEDCTGVSWFPRAATARAAGLRGAAAFPVRDAAEGGRTLAVLEFFGPRPLAPDAEMLRMLDAIGVQLAQFIRRKRDEDRAAEQEELRRAVLASLPAHIAVLDRDGRIIAVNDAWLKFARDNEEPTAGVAGASGVGANYLDVCGAIPPDAAADPAATAAASVDPVATNGQGGPHLHPLDDRGLDAARGIREVLAGRRSTFSLEYPCHAPTEERWFLMNVTPLNRPDGGAVVSHINITARKRAEAAMLELVRQLDAQHSRMEQLLANVPGVVWEAYGQPDDARQRINFVSRHVETMLGYGVEEWLSTPNFWLTIVHPDDREQAARSAMQKFTSPEGGGVSQFRWVRRDGRAIWVESHSNVIRDEKGSPIGMRGVTMDVTDRKRAHAALRRRANQLVRVARQLKQSNRELDQFAYITSHDLRAPLRGIANLATWIEEDLGATAAAVTPEVRKHFELLRGRVQRMENLIGGILEYSRVGRVRTEAEEVDVGRLLHEVVDLLAPPATARVEVEPGMPTLFAQRLRLQQVFMNLIGNALKHHDRPAEARVRVTCRDVGPADEAGFVEFAVSDDGPGIAPEYHDKVFVIFQTLQPRDKVESTGVGLSLVKKIVEGNGGAIRLTSREGAGATFAFTWPRRMKQRGPAPATRAGAPLSTRNE